MRSATPTWRRGVPATNTSFPTRFCTARPSTPTGGRWRAWTHSQTSDQRLIVGIADGAVVGFAHTGNGADETATLADGTSVVGELYGFYLHPDVWGSGVAPVMMNAAVDHLATLGQSRAVLWTLRDAHRARAFYEKSGWTPSGRTDTLTMYPHQPAAEVEYERSFV